jgi:hypothetical protein
MGENELRPKRSKVMDLITLVVFCNCTIAIGCLILTLLTVRLRQNLVAIARSCDRWSNDCAHLATTPVAIMAVREQIRQLRWIYQQQIVTTDFVEQRIRQRVWAMGLFIQIARFLLSQRVRWTRD